MAQGYGESKVFAAPPGSFPEERDWSKLTINGFPISDALRTQITYQMTDQGAAEANEGKEPRRVEVLRDRTRYQDIHDDGRKLEAYRDNLGDEDMLIVDDPMAAVMKENLPEGHRGLFMGEKKIKESGMIRGVLKYQPVLDEKGQPVTIGGMILASVPEKAARAAEGRYDALNQAKQVQAVEKVQESADQVMSEQKLMDMARRRRTLDDLAGLSVDNGDAAAEEMGLPHED